MSLRKIIDGKTYTLKKGIDCTSCAGGIINMKQSPVLCNKLGTDCLMGDSKVAWVEVKKKRFGRK